MLSDESLAGPIRLFLQPVDYRPLVLVCGLPGRGCRRPAAHARLCGRILASARHVLLPVSLEGCSCRARLRADLFHIHTREVLIVCRFFVVLCSAMAWNPAYVSMTCHRSWQHQVAEAFAPGGLFSGIGIHDHHHRVPRERVATVCAFYVEIERRQQDEIPRAGRELCRNDAETWERGARLLEPIGNIAYDQLRTNARLPLRNDGLEIPVEYTVGQPLACVVEGRPCGAQLRVVHFMHHFPSFEVAHDPSARKARGREKRSAGIDGCVVHRPLWPVQKPGTPGPHDLAALVRNFESVNLLACFGLVHGSSKAPDDREERAVWAVVDSIYACPIVHVAERPELVDLVTGLGIADRNDLLVFFDNAARHLLS